MVMGTRVNPVRNVCRKEAGRDARKLPRRFPIVSILYTCRQNIFIPLISFLSSGIVSNNGFIQGKHPMDANRMPIAVIVMLFVSRIRMQRRVSASSHVIRSVSRLFVRPTAMKMVFASFT